MEDKILKKSPEESEVPPKRAGDFEGPGRTHRVEKKERYDMDIRSYFENWKYLEAFHCYYLEDVVYCQNPLDENLQCLNLFVPEAYLDENQALLRTGVCGAYTASTAPIVVQSPVMGYSEVAPAMLQPGNPMPDQKIAGQFLEAGMIYVSVGVRGRQTRDERGAYIGKAPALVIDAKAAIRFYRHNRAYLPGNVERMIMVGVSAGGNLASLIGTTANHQHFHAGLEKIGAVLDEADAVYAVQAFCPITDLSHADMAYEWMFQGQDQRELPPFMKDKGDGRLTDFQKALSGALAIRYPEYVNSLGLTHPATGEGLVLEAEGRGGSLYDYLLEKLEDAATKYCGYLNEESPKALPCSVDNYLSGNYTVKRRTPRGEVTQPGLDKRDWLSWDGVRAHVTGLDAMEADYVERMKDCPSFDSLELTEFENEEFGSADQRCSHFNTKMADVLESLKERFPEEYGKYHPAYEQLKENRALQDQNFALNPLNFISEKSNGLCEHFRIRVGSMDAHTSFTTALLLAVSLMNAGKDVDFAYTWEAGHGVCDYEGELCQWIQSIC